MEREPGRASFLWCGNFEQHWRGEDIKIQKTHFWSNFFPACAIFDTQNRAKYNMHDFFQDFCNTKEASKGAIRLKPVFKMFLSNNSNAFETILLENRVGVLMTKRILGQT